MWSALVQHLTRIFYPISENNIQWGNCKALAKRWQHFDPAFRNILNTACWVRLATILWPVAACCELKIEPVGMPWPKNCCTNLAKRLQHHATSTNSVSTIWPVSNLSQEDSTCMSQHIATSRNMVAKRTQHFASNNVAVMLRWNVSIVWPGLKKRNTIFLFSET